MLSFLSKASECSPLPPITKDFIEIEIPDAPLSEDELLEKLQAAITSSTNVASRGFIGHMNSMPTTMSVLGDFVASALSNNMLFQELSPFFSPLELKLTKEFAKLFGLGENAGGVLLGAGSMSNLQALAVARNLKFNTLEKGLNGTEKQPVILASEAARASIRKAAMVLGLGMSSVIPIRTNSDSQMYIESLEREIKRAKAENKEPFCIVATVGTTITGNIDPLIEIAQIAKEYNLWFHADAAYGGALIFSETHKRKLAGIELADSITFNPQKWLYVSNGCSMALFKREDDLSKAFRVPSPYVQDSKDIINLGEITVHGSRRVEVLKLWLSLLRIGKRGYAQLVDECCRLADYFKSKIDERPFLQIVGTPDMNILCFRGVPDWIEETNWHEWNLNLQQLLLKEKNIFLSFSPYRGGALASRRVVKSLP